ncbi:MAG: 1,2-phenylacetyl-CoA epoxidase subunit PaaC [Bacteroidota bacterium]
MIRLGDDSLILGQRLAEWCGHGPILEEDIAMTNISLDLIGQATVLLKYAGELEGSGRDEDKLAFLRNERDFRNVLLVEQPNVDFGMTMLRQFLFDAYRKPLFELMQQSTDPHLAAIAEKSLKETRYHLKHSSEWVIRLGDGTEESHRRIQEALDTLWRYTDELFYSDELQKEMEKCGIAPAMVAVRDAWSNSVNEVMAEATLILPTNNWKFDGGRRGLHSEHMGYILADMQFMQRAYPNMEW